MQNLKEPNKTPSPILKKLKIQCILVPLILFMTHTPITSYLLISLIIYFGQKEYYTIESKLLKKLFTDQFSDSTSATLISSPLQAIIFLLLPLLIYLIKDIEILSFVLVIILITIYRLYSFIKIYQLNSIKDFEIKPIESNQKETIHKMKNPMPSLNHNKQLKRNNSSLYEHIQSISSESNASLSNYNTKNIMTSLKNIDKKYVTEKMFISTLVVISLDYIFIIIYAFPLCYGISIHHHKNGFIFIILVIIMSNFCQFGSNFTDDKVGYNNFGAPITPYKTIEGIYGGIILSITCSLIFKYFITYFTYINFFNYKQFILLIIFELLSSFLGKYINCFFNRCIDIQNSDNSTNNGFNILNYIDSICLGLPICYSFIKFIQ